MTAGMRADDLVQMEVSDAAGHTCQLDLGVFWRSHPPVVLDIGPVLHPDDAVAGKMDALFNRSAPRDFLDVAAILASGRYTQDQLLAVAAEHNPGFSAELFAESLSYLQRIPGREVTAYGVNIDQIGKMRREFSGWEDALRAAPGWRLGIQDLHRHNPGARRWRVRRKGRPRSGWWCRPAWRR